jgi:segregation and condensation protein A
MGDSEKVGQEQVHELLFENRLSWQAIIYDLINTEQLDPWDIDLGVLANKYLKKVRELEEADFFISSKVLFAASLLLRIKSDILLNHELANLDNVLFGKKEEAKYQQERIELDEELPDLIPRTPLPRYRRVTLQELMGALRKAIKTENRRIKREVILKKYIREAEDAVPKNTLNISDKIKDIYGKLKSIFSNREEKLAFSELLQDDHNDKDQRVAAFVSLLHLDTQQRVWIEQNGHFEEIWILMKHLYDKKKSGVVQNLIEEMEKEALTEEKIVEASGFDVRVE